jgi:hypothetical protein
VFFTDKVLWIHFGNSFLNYQGNIHPLKEGAIMIKQPNCQTKGVDRFACAQAGCAECTQALLKENNSLIWMVMLQQAIGKAEYDDLAQ